MRKAARRAQKLRESMLAQVQINAEMDRAARAQGLTPGGSGSVRPTRAPVAPHRNLAPKKGYFTKSVKSGPCFNVAV